MVSQIILKKANSLKCMVFISILWGAQTQTMEQDNLSENERNEIAHYVSLTPQREPISWNLEGGGGNVVDYQGEFTEDVASCSASKWVTNQLEVKSLQSLALIAIESNFEKNDDFAQRLACEMRKKNITSLYFLFQKIKILIRTSRLIDLSLNKEGKGSESAAFFLMDGAKLREIKKEDLECFIRKQIKKHAKEEFETIKGPFNTTRFKQFLPFIPLEWAVKSTKIYQEKYKATFSSLSTPDEERVADFDKVAEEEILTLATNAIRSEFADL